jgi:phospholipase C
MNGFARIGGRNTLGFFNTADHPFYSWLLRQFAMSDRYFASVLGPTYPNRQFMTNATSDGQMDNTGIPTANDNVFREIERAGRHTWGEYTEPFNDPTRQSWQDLSLNWPRGHHNVYDYRTLATALRNGSLPNVAFVNSRTRSEHPAQSIHDGERFVREIVTAAFASPLWAHLAVIITYDEGGGFFDHVAPPSACPPTLAAANAEFNRLGMRVPLVVVSPYARAGYVSSLTHSHTSVTRFIQALFDLPAMTRRDANSDALLDMFDFGCPAFARPPTCVPAAAPPGC